MYQFPSHAHEAHEYTQWTPSENIFFLFFFAISAFLTVTTLTLNASILLASLMDKDRALFRNQLWMLLPFVDLLPGTFSWMITAHVILSIHLRKPWVYSAGVQLLIEYQLTFSTLYTLCMIALEHYLAMTRPLFHKKYLRATTVILPSIQINLVLFGMGVYFVKTHSLRLFVFLQLLGFLAILLLLTTIGLYTMMWLSLLWFKRGLSHRHTRLHRYTRNLRVMYRKIHEEMAEARSSIHLFILFAICYMPRFFCFLCHMSGHCPIKGHYMNWMSALIAMSKTVWSPLFYLWRLNERQKEHRKLA